VVGFAAAINSYLGHKAHLYSEVAHKQAEYFLKKWEKEGKLKRVGGFWYLVLEKW